MEWEKERVGTTSITGDKNTAVGTIRKCASASPKPSVSPVNIGTLLAHPATVVLIP